MEEGDLEGESMSHEEYKASSCEIWDSSFRAENVADNGKKEVKRAPLGPNHKGPCLSGSVWTLCHRWRAAMEEQANAMIRLAQ